MYARRSHLRQPRRGVVRRTSIAPSAARAQSLASSRTIRNQHLDGHKDALVFKFPNSIRRLMKSHRVELFARAVPACHRLSFITHMNSLNRFQTFVRRHSGHHHLLNHNYRAYRDIAQELKEGQQVTLLGLVVNVFLTIGHVILAALGVLLIVLLVRELRGSSVTAQPSSPMPFTRWATW